MTLGAWADLVVIVALVGWTIYSVFVEHVRLSIKVRRIPLSKAWDVPPDAMRSVLPEGLDAYGEPITANKIRDSFGLPKIDNPVMDEPLLKHTDHRNLYHLSGAVTHRSTSNGMEHLGTIEKCGACK